MDGNTLRAGDPGPGRRFDVAVVGAGAVGLSAALAFDRIGLATCLVGAPPEGRDGRTAALLEGSLKLLRTLGIGRILDAQSAPLRAMRIVDDTGSLFRPPPVEFQAAEIGREAFGRNIENATLVRTLSDAVHRRESIAWLREAALAAEGSAFGAVRLAGGDLLSASLLVAADGRHSTLRSSAGLKARERRYPQAALTTILRHAGEHHDASTEFHTRAGPFTFVPLRGRRSSLVWVTRPDDARRLHGLDDAALCREIERQSHRLLGHVELDGPRAVVPLSLVEVDEVVAGRLVLLGEAAHALPPIGAQGLNMGLADVAALVRLVGASADADVAAAIPALLRSYQRERRSDVKLRTLAVDGINRMLLSGLLPSDLLRGVGLGALGRIGPLRRAVMRQGINAGS